jgi:hypothetical protein
MTKEAPAALFRYWGFVLGHSLVIGGAVVGHCALRVRSAGGAPVTAATAVESSKMADQAIEPDVARMSGEWQRHAGAVNSEAKKFLQGPQPRKFEFWQAVKIFRELVYGFRKLHFVGPCVTVFGSARFDAEHRYYRMAREVGRYLAESGFTVMTGGGPGIMEAANRGAKDVAGRSLGCNIVLPREQSPTRSSIRGSTSSTSSSAS